MPSTTTVCIVKEMLMQSSRPAKHGMLIRCVFYFGVSGFTQVLIVMVFSGLEVFYVGYSASIHAIEKSTAVERGSFTSTARE